jgi:hypothetical protein
MTFADLIYKGFVWVEGKFTRGLAIAGGTIAILASSDVIPATQMKYWMAAIAVLTFWRGQSTSKTYDQAKAVLSSATSPVVVGPPIVMAQVKEAPATPVSPAKVGSIGD